MSPYYSDDQVTLWHGDCLDILRELADNSVDAVVTDPPYGLEFMGKEWDAPWKAAGDVVADPADVGGFQDGNGGNPFSRSRIRFGFGAGYQSWCQLWATECLRVLKPGGYMLAFGGTRTWHRLASAIEDAGFEIRDSIAWLYGSGFPKSLDVSKAIDRRKDWTALPLLQGKIRDARTALGISQSEAARRIGLIADGESLGGGGFMWFETGMRTPTAAQYAALKSALALDDECDEVFQAAEREVITYASRPGMAKSWTDGTGWNGGASVGPDAVTDAAKQWQGWGTSLKPAFEPLVCARKPFNPVPLDWRLVTTVHHALAGLLWLSLSPVKRAETCSPSKNPEQPEAWCVSAHVSAALDTSPDESATTATFSSQAAESTCLSIASLWSAILAALSDPMSTSTTSTKSSTTTGLRILNSLLAPITSPSTIPRCECLHAGFSSHAPNAADSSSDEWSRWTHTLNASVPGNVIEPTAIAVCNALASIADELSIGQGAANSAHPSATTGAASRNDSAAFEPIVVARKPLAGTVAANVQAYGTGALNVDACRVGTGGQLKWSTPRDMGYHGGTKAEPTENTAGRWPANVVLDGGMADELDKQSGNLPSQRTRTDPTRGTAATASHLGTFNASRSNEYLGEQGGASRFFPTFRYTAKAPGTERPTADGVAHPTVKPLELMRWLIRLVTPPGGTALDPFAGSGTTGEAAIHEHKKAILIEREPTYLPLIVARLSKPMAIGFDFEGEAS